MSTEKKEKYDVRAFLNIQTSNTEIVPIIIKALDGFTIELAEYGVVSYTNIQSGAPTNPPPNPPKP